MCPAQKAKPEIRPIGCVESLARVLGISPAELLSISEQVDVLWKPGKKLLKKQGGWRSTHDAREPLKSIHEKIKNRILKKVFYPPYLKGGVEARGVRRDHKAHAAEHAGQRVCFSEDIQHFFPSTGTEKILHIWQYFFNFPPEVSRLLSTITTFKNELPQGWKTSSYLANLALWEHEPPLVEAFSKKGLRYTRFVDDITVSSNDFVSPKMKLFIVSEIVGMLNRSGYKHKRAKHTIATAGNLMRVTGLNVNAGRPTMPKEERNRIRVMVFQCERMFENTRNSRTYIALWRSVSGKVANLARFHPRVGAKYRLRLNQVRPQMGKRKIA